MEDKVPANLKAVNNKSVQPNANAISPHRHRYALATDRQTNEQTNRTSPKH